MGLMETKLNLGSGRLNKEDYCNIDIIGYIDNGGIEKVDLIMDIEKERLPFEDNSIEEILADNLLEHLEDLRFMLNECHRVLKEDGILKGCVPIANTPEDLKDPTHKRRFVRDTFAYFTGTNQAKTSLPSRPKYADYGYKPFNLISLDEKGNMLYFKMFPRKIC